MHIVSENGLQSKIFKISQHIEELKKQSLGDPDKVAESLMSALEELEVSLEELSTADDELYQQNEDLVDAQNETQRLLTAVQEEKDRLSALINSINDEIWFADTQKRFTLANPSALLEFGYATGEEIDVEKLAANLEVYRPDGSPRPVEEAPPLRALNGEVVRNQEEIIRTPATGELRYRQACAAPVRDANGNIIGSVSVVRDITEQKRIEKALRESEQRVKLKLDSILSPEGDISNLELADIIDVQAIQSLMDNFYKLAHIPVFIVDLKGNVLDGVGWQDICTKFHRVHPEACKNCTESDTQLSSGVPQGEFRLYKCKNNMWDAVTPLMVGGQHIGNLFTGQFFFEDEPLDYELFKSQARQYGFNEEEYISALETVPLLSKESVDTSLNFFTRLANMISQLSYSNIKLARSLAERTRAEDALQEAKDHLESHVKKRTAELELANSALEKEIAERKDAEEAVKAERQRFNDVLEMLPAYLVLLSPDYHVPFANRFFRERFGESNGRRCFDFLFGRSEPCEVCETYKVLKTNEPHHGEWTGPDGRNYDIFDFPFTDTDGSTCIMEMGIDITERKHAEEALRARALQQEVVARLGLQALAGSDPAILMAQAVSELAKTLGVEYTKVLKLMPDGSELLLVAGVGWQEGLVGRGTVGSGKDSQAGYTLLSSEPVIVEDLRTETRFSGPPLLHEHGVISGMSVIISGHGRPFGVLGVHTVKRRAFTADDVHFLQAVANLIAMAVEQKRVEAELEKHHEHLEELVQERTSELEAANEELQEEIDEREQAEDALVKERANLQTIFDVVNVGMLLIDENGVVKRINNTVSNWIGKKDLSAFCGHQPGDHLGCIHAVNEPVGCGHTPHCATCLIRKAFETVLCSGQSVHGVETEATLMIGGNETCLWIEASVDPLILEGKQHAIMAVNDITDRKRAEESLQESEQRFRDAIDNFPNVFVIYGPDRRIQFINSKGLQITDISEQEAIGRRDEEIYPPELINSYLPALKRAIETKMPQTIERTRSARMGGQVVVVNIIPLLDERENIRRVLGITYDITDRKRMEDDLMETRDYLELRVRERTAALSKANEELDILYKQIQRHSAELEHTVAERTKWLEAANKELESFSYSVSHDLRAPLRAMDGFSRILLDDYSTELPQEAKRYLQLVRSSAQQMGRLIDEMLAFSRLGRQPINKQCVMTIDLVNNVLEELKNERADRRIDIVIGDLPSCEADAAMLKQVFINLISNALKFTRKQENAQIEIGSQEREGIVVYFVKDNGAGFDMQYVNKLFGVFQRLHSTEEYEGTGVGLANVQRIVHRHGGSIWAEGEVDKGATFYFTLDEGVLK